MPQNSESQGIWLNARGNETGVVLLAILFVLMVVFVGGGFIVGYFIGRSSGSREAKRGFPVHPTNPNRPS